MATLTEAEDDPPGEVAVTRTEYAEPACSLRGESLNSEGSLDSESSPATEVSLGWKDKAQR